MARRSRQRVGSLGGSSLRPRCSAACLSISDVLLAGPDSEALWAAAALAPHASPVPLLTDETWLSEHLSAKVLNRSEGTVISVAGAVGGSGATTIAYLLAAEAAVRGDRVLLLDGDAGFGSGLHHVNERAHTVSGAAAYGLALPELIAAEGEISASHLTRAVPVVDGIHLLTGGAETDSDQLRSRMGSIVRAGARAFDAVIVDVGRRALPQAVAERTDQILLVARPTPRAAAAASRLIESVPHQPVAVMTNGRPASGWGPDEMSHQLGTEIVADLAEQRWLRAADELLRPTRCCVRHPGLA
ncbi:hypothetical protein [Nesterenkonia pannonica]|uniref:hypothetical protein n=1 Tax=Nesterenkonia pannonica TaxID=1548602 RepID=UPI002164970E|nr:hypothetical protein [Nesterenkonia pannonica]